MNSSPQLFDLLIKDAIFITADPSQPLIRNGYLGVAQGVITYLSQAEPKNYRATTTMSLPGHFVTPGFVNPHAHSILSMVRGVASDLGFAPSYTPGIPKGTQVNPEQARALAQLGALEALLFGSTVLGDNFVHADIAAQAMAELGMRLCPSWRIHDVDFAKVAHGEWHHDAAIGARTLGAGMALYETWKDHPLVKVNLAAHAVDTCSEGFLKEVAELSTKHNLVVSTHLGQSQVEVKRVHERTGHTSTEVLYDTGLLNDRLMCGHCIYVTDSDIAKMAAHNAHVVHIPKPNATSGRLAPTPKLKAAGINICLATDTQHADMVELMRWALITARIQEGGVNETWQPDHVFHMATMGGAKALSMQDTLGSLTVGKAADFVVINGNRPHLTPHVNPVGNLVHTGQGRDVLHVVVAGDFVVRDGLPTRVDMDEVVRHAETAARQLWGAEGVQYWLQ
jgi:5-methylthioadenosine/S-adenosylhomocysteine deaminase